MQRKLLSSLVLGLILFSAAAALADGDFYVGGPWGTKITSLPYEIKTPGAYYLGGNLSYAGSGDGITVPSGVNHVTLDLMGFTLNGSGSGHYGIYLNVCKNVEIRNGTVTGWGVGIWGTGQLHRVINVRAVGNLDGIALTESGGLIKGCEVTATGEYNSAIRIRQGTVSDCMVRMENCFEGISINDGGTVSDNVVIGIGNSNGQGIYALNAGTLIKGNKVSGCTYAIYGEQNGMNVIGNTVDAASDTTGVFLTDDYVNLLDQNTVTGGGTRYNATYTKVQWRSKY
jgi:hypothetical protein